MFEFIKRESDNCSSPLSLVNQPSLEPVTAQSSVTKQTRFHCEVLQLFIHNSAALTYMYNRQTACVRINMSDLIGVLVAHLAKNSGFKLAFPKEIGACAPTRYSCGHVNWLPGSIDH